MMTTYTVTTTVSGPYEEIVEAVRATLSTPGFGILTEIDLGATAMMGLADSNALHTVTGDAKQRLTAALAALDSTEGAS